MIYPKDIVEFVLNNQTLQARFAQIISEHELHVTTIPALEKENDSFEIWVLEQGYKHSTAVKRYLFFLSTLSKIFYEIYRFFDKINPDSKGEKDQYAVATSPEEMMYIARYLYYLESYGIPGDVLECGSFKGFSTCCLSWACHLLGKKLIVADSFQGLPDIGHSYYQKADFKGSFEMVEENVMTLGRRDNVKFIKGWYNESLVGFSHPLSLLWMDVDLYQSASDVLTNVFSVLSRNGVIFSHEFRRESIDNDEIGRDNQKVGEVAQAIREFLHVRNVPHKAKFLTNNLGIIVPYAQEGAILLSPLKHNLITYQIRLEMSDVADFEKCEIPETETCFSIDSINQHPICEQPLPVSRSDEITILGWAIDEKAHRAASGVCIELDGKLFPALYGLSRDDVALSLGSYEYKWCGFRAILPVAEIGHGTHRITLKILSKDKTYCYAPRQSVIIEN